MSVINHSWWKPVTSCGESAVCRILGEDVNEPEAAFVLDSSQPESVQPVGRWIKFSVLWFSKPKHVRHVQTPWYVAHPRFQSFTPVSVQWTYMHLLGLFSVSEWDSMVILCRPCLAMHETDNHLSVQQVAEVC